MLFENRWMRGFEIKRLGENEYLTSHCPEEAVVREVFSVVISELLLMLPL